MNEYFLMQNVERLQAWLKQEQLAGLVIFSSDEFQNEYNPPSARRLAWATAFTGSVGQAVVLQDKAALFVDGRYTTQGHQQADADQFEVLSLVPGAVPAWLSTQIEAGDILALDARLHTAAEVGAITEVLGNCGASLKTLDNNPIDALWEDQPAPEREPVELYELEYAGESSQSKRRALAGELKAAGLSAYLVSAPEELAWLLNVRGSDLPATPVCLSYALMAASGDVYWFIDSNRLSSTQQAELDSGIQLHSPETMNDILTQHFEGSDLDPVGVNEARTPWHLHQHLSALVGVRHFDGLEVRKSCKNDVELDGARRAQHIDGIAMIRFLSWIAEAIKTETITEQDVANKVTECRKASGAFKDISFTPISASGPNAALAHYSVTKESNRVLNDSNMFLLDSGGQYKGGTTDITRTLSLGAATDFQKKCFTLVLKGHIALAQARFPKGTTGGQIDVLARQHLWQNGLDYAHGTGHGVGSFLSVHEGPASISKRPIAAPLRAGMIMSNEPGYYLEGEFGIRIENLVIVRESSMSGYLEFETITEVPLDSGLIDTSILDQGEKTWLKTYHQRIDARYQGKLEGREQSWLQAQLAFYREL
jgi:Xaa-Pro aminopeptidase